jgi:hypothetical protein
MTVIVYAYIFVLKAYNVLVRKPKGKRRPRCRWEDGIRIDLGEIVWGCRVDSVG